MSSHRYSTSSFQRRAVLLACARELCHDPKLMADVFVNYDCDLDSTNLFERFVEALASVAAGFPTVFPRLKSAQQSPHTSTSHAQQLRCRLATALPHASQNRRHPLACDASEYP